MDPFTALGLASNVIQFVDFVWNLISETRRIGKAGDGLMGDHRVLEAIVADIQQYSNAISPPAKNNPLLNKLANECSFIAADLLIALESLKLKGNKTHWESFLMALKQVWKQSKIDKLSTQLFRAQSQVASHMQLIMVDNMSDLNRTMRRLCETNDNFNLETQYDLRKLTSSIVSMAEEVKSNNARFQGYTETIRRSDVVHTATAQGITVQLHQIPETLSGFRDSSSEATAICREFSSTMDNYVKMLLQPQAVPTDLSSKILTCVQHFETQMRGTKAQDSARELQDGMLAKIKERASELKVWEASLEQDAKTISQQLQLLSASLQNLDNEGQALAIYHSCLRRLHYAEMNNRMRKIENAHSPTFEWMFAESKEGGDKAQLHHGFVQWLRNENNPFWIQGKPGSGKSTLMKFVADHPETLRHLRYWAADKDVVVASFYFWIAGTHLEKSQEGLLRSLLFQIICKCPELVLPVREKLKFCGNLEGLGLDTQWSLDELLEIYKTVLGNNIRKRFCFFIDGLDEFQGASNGHRDLIKTLRDLANSPGIKLCLSSRPWMIFEDEFGDDEMWYLKLQDLTKDDIRQVVSDRFKAHPHLIRLQKSQDKSESASLEMEKYHDVMDNVVNKSQGVFLWVHLVLRSLLDGLTFGDSVRTLQSRLEAFPDDLDGFFQHMLDSIPKIYRPRAARMFKLALSVEQPLYLLFYSLLQDLEERGDLTIDQKIYGMSNPEMERRKHGMRRILDGWSRCLLEVENTGVGDPFLQDCVNFLHRTARDFLEASETSFLRQEAQCSEVEESLLPCKAVLAMIRRVPGQNRRIDIESPLLQLFFRFCNRASHQQGTFDALGDLSSRMKATYSELSRTKHQYVPGAAGSRMVFNKACRFGAFFYIEWEFSQTRHPRSLVGTKDGPALYHALSGSRPSVEIVRLLIRYGADPNQVISSSANGLWTPWTYFMRYLSGDRDIHSNNRSKQDDFELVRCLLLAGAKLDHIVTDWNDHTTTARATIKQYFPAHQATILLDCTPKWTRMVTKALWRR